MTVTLEQHNSIPSIQDIDSIDNWIMVFSSPLKRRKFPYQEQILNRYNKLSQKDKNGFPVAIDLPNKNLSHVSFAMLDSNIGSFDFGMNHPFGGISYTNANNGPFWGFSYNKNHVNTNLINF